MLRLASQSFLANLAMKQARGPIDINLDYDLPCCMHTADSGAVGTHRLKICGHF